MRIVWQIVAVLCMVIAALTILLNLAGMAAMWGYYGQTKQVLTETLTVGETVLQESGVVLEDANGLLIQGQQKVQDVQAKTTSVQTELATIRPVVDTASFLVDQDLQPTVDSVWQGILGVQMTLTAIQQLMAEFENVVEMPAVLTQGIDEVVGWVDAVVQVGTSATNEVNAIKRQVNEQVLQPVLDTTTELDQTMGEIQTQVEDIGQEVQTTEAMVSTLIPQIPAYVTWTWIAITVVLLWLILAQVALFYWALVWFRTGSLRISQLSSASEPALPSANAP